MRDMHKVRGRRHSSRSELAHTKERSFQDGTLGETIKNPKHREIRLYA